MVKREYISGYLHCSPPGECTNPSFKWQNLSKMQRKQLNSSSKEKKYIYTSSFFLHCNDAWLFEISLENRVLVWAYASLPLWRISLLWGASHFQDSTALQTWNKHLFVQMEGGDDHVLDIICLWSGHTVAFYVPTISIGLNSLVFQFCFAFLITLNVKFMYESCGFTEEPEYAHSLIWKHNKLYPQLYPPREFYVPYI